MFVHGWFTMCTILSRPTIEPRISSAAPVRILLHLTRDCRLHHSMTDNGIPVEIWHEIFGVILRVDFWEPTHAFSFAWRDREHNYDLKARHEECWNRQGPLRLVSRRWRALVETYLCTWLHLRYQGEEVAMRPITSHYTYIGLPANDIACAPNTNTITTLSISLHKPLVISFIQNAIDSLPPMPRLRALHVELEYNLVHNKQAISRVVFRLLQLGESSLFSFHLRTRTSIGLQDQPPINLPKLQRFQLRSAVCRLNDIGIAHWQLPSLQHLRATIYPHKELAPAFRVQLRSLSAACVNGGSFWEDYPYLASLYLYAGLMYFIAPPIDHPIRELVLPSRRIRSPWLLRQLLHQFIGGSNPDPQGSSPTLISSNRKIVLEGLKWMDSVPPFREMILPNAGWHELAPYVEDELGETLASARTRYLQYNTEESGALQTLFDSL